MFDHSRQPKLTGFPIPILFAVQSVRGKARVRIQVIPEPPFVKTVVFGFEGLPQVELNAYVRFLPRSCRIKCSILMPAWDFN